MTTSACTRIGLGLLTASLVMGCAGNVRKAADQMKSQNNLKEIYLMYAAYQKDSGKPPAKAEDLAKYKVEYAQGYQGLQEGRYTVVWNVPLDSAGMRKVEKAVLAHETNAGDDGKRSVILGGGEVKVMTEEEFQAAPKAAAGQ